MVFAISWSSVSIASVNVMQMSMQHEQMMYSFSSTEHQEMMKQASLQQIKNHCIDMQEHNNDHNQSINHDQQANDLNSCHTQTSQSKHLQAPECQDCALFSCQSSVVWFNSDIPKMVMPDHFQNSHSYQVNYQAQHLAGFWQEILRPPKA
jgi:hypothetical protein